MFLQQIIKGITGAGLYSVGKPIVIRSFANDRLINITVMVPQNNKPKWDEGPTHIFDISEQLAKKYNLLNTPAIPLDHYLWILQQERDNKKWINVKVRVGEGVTQLYKLSKSYAQSYNIIEDTIIPQDKFKEIPTPRRKEFKCKDYIDIKVGFPPSAWGGFNTLNIPNEYAQTYNIEENSYLSWEEYKELRTKIDRDKGVYCNFGSDDGALPPS